MDWWMAQKKCDALIKTHVHPASATHTSRKEQIAMWKDSYRQSSNQIMSVSKLSKRVDACGVVFSYIWNKTLIAVYGENWL